MTRHTGSTCKSLGCNPQGIAANRLRCLVPQYRRSVVKAKTSDTTECAAMVNTNFRRDFLGLILGISSLFVGSLEAKGAALPPKDKPKLCDEACEKELENVPMVTTESGLQYKDIKVGQGPSPPVGFQVAANYVAMIPSEQVFDRMLWCCFVIVGGPKAACAGCVGFAAFSVVIEKFLDRHE
nr:peptidyl-prolyl cis-trans isomerase FKBP16-3, chloroplastic-like [Arachis hypogaea]